MTIQRLKPFLQDCFRPVTRVLARIGITANQVTVFSFLMSLTIGALLMIRLPDENWFLLLPGIFLVRMTMNIMDGMLAQEHHMKTRGGFILNELTDVVSDTALYLPFALLPETTPALVVGVVLLSQLAEMAGILGPLVGASRRNDGPMGHADRGVVFGVVALLLGLGVPLDPYLDYLWCFMMLLLFFTIINRCNKALQEGAKTSKEA